MMMVMVMVVGMSDMWQLEVKVLLEHDRQLTLLPCC